MAEFRETSELEPKPDFRFLRPTARGIVGEGYDCDGLDVLNPIPEKEIRKRSIAMFNVLGNASRSIIQEVGDQDFSRKLFLTEDDLEKARSIINPEGLNEEQLAELSDDMLQFMQECFSTLSLNSVVTPERTKVHPFSGQMVFIRRIEGFLEGRRGFLKRVFSKPLKRLTKEEEIDLIRQERKKLKEKYQSQIPDNVRGIPVKNLDTRLEGKGMYGSRCPVVDCGHQFKWSFGIKIADHDGSLTGKPRWVRMNEAVAHLVSHGVCSNGETKDWDQRYLTLTEYMPLFERKKTDEGAKEKPDSGKMQTEFSTMIAKKTMEVLGVEIEDVELEKLVEEILSPTF